jgi:hypothetical protein
MMGGLLSGLGGLLGDAASAVGGNASSSAAFNSALQSAGEQGIQNNLQSGEEQLQLQQAEDAANTALALAGQQEKDNAQNAQKIIGDMT